MRVGVDVVAVERVSALLARRRGFLARVFTDREISDSLRGDVSLSSATAAARLAARFAAKEAARKALDLALAWRDVEVRTASDGAPTLWVRGAQARASLSLAHDGGIAIAFVIAGSQQSAGRAGGARERSRPSVQKEV
ncbi:MAG: 4'-phosphopantetheinyl transferase superfamily protein [Actinomycetota bacterium]|nr:4'-phosphopantetheinyl transferase superfamily protein [Actinomycetota bacterium]